MNKKPSGKAADLVTATELRNAGLTVLVDGWPDLLVVSGSHAYGVELKRPGDTWDGIRQQGMAEVFANIMKVPYLLARDASSLLELDLGSIPRDYRPLVVGDRTATIDVDPRLIGSRKP